MTGRRGSSELIPLLIFIGLATVVCWLSTLGSHLSSRGTPGAHVRVKATGVVAVVVAIDTKTTPSTYICRIDNGPDAKPRYAEIRFAPDELEVTEALER